MGWFENSLTADDWGICVGDPEFAMRAFSWESVSRLRAYAIATEGDRFSVVEVHHDDDWEEILSDWRDFPAVADGLSAYLTGLRPDWLDIILGLPAGVQPVTVWERPA